MKNMHVAIPLLSILLTSCGGSSSSSPSNSSSSYNSSSLTSLEKIDCTKLNPNKVYLMGTLSESEQLYAIADPANPADFCVGFDSYFVNSAVISSKGKLVYVRSHLLNFYSMIPESLIKVPDLDTPAPDDLIWQYPVNTADNDIVVFTSNEESCGLLNFKLLPGTDNLFYSCPNRTIHTELISSYYDIGSTSENALLSVFPDGSLLVFTYEEKLKIVSPSLNETVLTMPASVPDPVCTSARQFIDSQSNSVKAWVECYDRNYHANQDENLHRRYTVDTITSSIQDDGVFSPSPLNVREHLGGKFDSEGNLWQTGDLYNEPSTHIIVKRPVNGKNAKIIYSEAFYQGTGDWRKDPTPFVKIRNLTNSLITGY